MQRFERSDAIKIRNGVIFDFCTGLLHVCKALCNLYLRKQEEQCVFADAVGLVTYYMKRASSLQHEEALKIRSFLTHTLADLCYYQRWVESSRRASALALYSESI